jgi:hypothetical protein
VGGGHNPGPVQREERERWREVDGDVRGIRGLLGFFGWRVYILDVIDELMGRLVD